MPPFLTFVITAAIWGKETAINAGAVGLFVTVVAWMALFAWSIPATIYDDHTTLVAERDAAHTALRTERSRAADIASRQERDRNELKHATLAAVQKLLSDGTRLQGDYASSGRPGGKPWADVQREMNRWREGFELFHQKPFKLGTYEYVKTQEGTLIDKELEHIRAILADPDKWLTRF